MLVPAGISHQVRWAQSIHPTTFHLHTALLHRVAQEWVSNDSFTLIPKFETEDQGLFHLAMALKAELLRPHRPPVETPYEQYLVTALAWRLVSHHSTYLAQSPRQTNQLDPAVLKQVLEYINTYLDRPIQLSHLATLVNLSELDLWEGFTATMGMNPYHYIQGQRRQRTQELLRHLAPHPELSLNFETPPRFKTLPTSRLDLTLAQLNSVVLAYGGRSLTDTQVEILTGVLKGKRYSEIAQQYQLSEGHIKTIASELWQLLSQAMGQPVRKANLRSTLRQYRLLSD